MQGWRRRCWPRAVAVWRQRCIARQQRRGLARDTGSRLRAAAARGRPPGAGPHGNGLRRGARAARRRIAFRCRRRRPPRFRLRLEVGSRRAVAASLAGRRCRRTLARRRLASRAGCQARRLLARTPLIQVPLASRPTLDDVDRRVLIEAVALIEPASLSDADRDTIAAAIRTGRARLDAARSPRDALTIAEEVRLSAPRRTLLSWTVMHDPGRVAAFLSPSELFWLGLGNARVEALQAWGAPAGPRLGCHVPAVRPDRRPWESRRRPAECGDDGERVSRSESPSGRTAERPALAGGAPRSGVDVGDARLRQRGDQPRPGRSARSRRVRSGLAKRAPGTVSRAAHHRWPAGAGRNGGGEGRGRSPAPGSCRRSISR